jgi:hypothetical protein
VAARQHWSNDNLSDNQSQEHDEHGNCDEKQPLGDGRTGRVAQNKALRVPDPDGDLGPYLAAMIASRNVDDGTV